MTNIQIMTLGQTISISQKGCQEKCDRKMRQGSQKILWYKIMYLCLKSDPNRGCSFWISNRRLIDFFDLSDPHKWTPKIPLNWMGFIVALPWRFIAREMMFHADWNIS